jgi:hypothetical protein
LGKCAWQRLNVRGSFHPAQKWRKLATTPDFANHVPLVRECSLQSVYVAPQEKRMQERTYDKDGRLLGRNCPNRS